MDVQRLFKIIVTGDVQGVGFRAMTRQFARRNSIKGSVKNLAGGEVDIMIYGTEEEANLIRRFCASSPGLSDVHDVQMEEVHDETLKKTYKNTDGFWIDG